MIRRCMNCKYGYEDTYYNNYLDKFWCIRFPQWYAIDDKMSHFCGEWRSEYE